MKSPLRPFVPAWLNQAGLSQAEFRVFCCLAARADLKTGFAWPSVETIATDCIMAKRTVLKSLRELIARGLIRRSGKPFGGSTRYEILSPTGAPSAPIEAPPIGAIETPIEESPTGANEAPNADLPIGARNAPPIGANRTPQLVQMRPQEGITKKVNHRRVTNTEISADGFEFADWFKGTLPHSLNLPNNWRNSYAKTFDDLVRLDKRSPSEIRKVSEWARNDPFWNSNFLSPAKLRARNRDRVQYFDVFAQRMTTAPMNGSAGKTLNLGRRGHYDGYNEGAKID